MNEIQENKELKKAKFNTKIVSDMKHNGEIVDVIGFTKGKDIYNDRYTVRFKDGSINNNIMGVELEFDFKRNKKKNREAR